LRLLEQKYSFVFLFWRVASANCKLLGALAVVHMETYCTNSFSVDPRLPTSVYPCDWRNFLGFIAILAGIILLLGVIFSIIALLFCVIRKFGKKRLNNVDPVKFAATYSFFSVILGLGTIAATFSIIWLAQDIVNLSTFAEQKGSRLESQMEYMYSNLSYTLPAIYPTYRNFTIFNNQVLLSLNKSESVLSAQKMMAVQVQQMMTTLHQLDDRIMELEAAQSDLLELIDGSSLNLEHIIVPYPFKPNEVVPYTSQFRELNDTATNATTLFRSMTDATQELHDDLIGSTFLFNGYVRRSLMEVDQEDYDPTLKEIQSVRNILRDHIQEQKAPSKIRSAVIAIASVLGVLLIVLLLILSLSICGIYRKSALTMRASSCVAMTLVIPSFVLTTVMFIIALAASPYCMTGPELFKGSQLPQTFSSNQPNFTAVANFTNYLMNCAGNQTIYDIEVLVGWEKSILNRHFEQQLMMAFDILQLCEAPTRALGNDGLKLLPKIPALTIKSKALETSIPKYVTLIKRFTTQVSNMSSYDPDNLSFTTFDQFISDINKVTAVLSLSYTRDNISSLGQAQIHDPRLKEEEQQKLATLYTGVRPIDVKYEAIKGFIGAANDWATSTIDHAEDTVQSSVKVLEQVITNIKLALGSVLKSTVTMIDSLEAIDQKPFVSILTVLSNRWDDFQNSARCAYLGEAVTSATSQVCSSMFPNIASLAIVFFVVGLALFVLSLISVLTAEKFEVKEEEEFGLLSDSRFNNAPGSSMTYYVVN
jgi:hypothetical protein